jgi:chlorobactene glucosyltransferase
MRNWPWAGAALTAAVPLLGLRAERMFRRLPRLPELLAAPGALPSLSIIVPARNEAGNLARLLPSLYPSAYPGQLEVIVVDDCSQDETAAVAEVHGARVIRLAGLPQGWLGKPHACHQGAVVATGEWLLFIDADTRYAPGAAARAVLYALHKNLDGLSLFLAQETSGWLDSLALMAAFAGLFAGLPPRHALLNGQFVLLRRSVYEATSGFAAVRDEPLEDLAFGHRLAQFGYRVPAVLGQDAGAVRMYSNVRQLWHGLARISSGSLGWSGRWGLVSALFIAGSAMPLLALPAVVRGKVNGRWALAGWAVVVLSFIPWARRFGNSAWALLAPIGAVVVPAVAVGGMLAGLLGRGLLWKGRLVKRGTG